jgi:fructosamine-3-kinase
MSSEQVFSLMATEIGVAIGTTLLPSPTARVCGGSIGECYRWNGNLGSIFVKLASVENRATFEAEAAGLDELSRADAIRVPKVLCVGANTAKSWIALEWIRFGARSRTTDRLLGQGLARLHRRTADVFGWRRDNTIGSTPQLNAQLPDWPAFFRDRRLRFQLDLAQSKGYGGRLQQRGAALLDRVGQFFAGYQPLPSLLHGDLWGGNWATDEHTQPVVFDPAVYYGDREADLAMTRLFGGFGADFYSAYQATWPLDPGAPARTGLYNLYHVLNHLNLFGSGYLTQATSMIDGLMAELGH